MIRLDHPLFSATESLNLCNEGINTPELKVRFNAGIHDLRQLAETYQTQAQAGELFSIPPLERDANDDLVITVGITKKEFINLYEYYLRNKDKPGRAIYDHLLVSANEKCPYCGGIGRPKNLDHYMPKAYFPQFSVFPLNLIPSCRDCNMDGKGQAFARTSSEQVIHPYLDKDIFFNEQWINAQINTYDPCSIEYFVSPQTNWSSTDNERVERHFNDFELAIRYGIQAAEELSIIIDLRRGIMKNTTSIDFREYLSSITSTSTFINHWKRIMYQCLADDDEFCNYDF